MKSVIVYKIYLRGFDMDIGFLMLLFLAGAMFFLFVIFIGRDIYETIKDSPTSKLDRYIKSVNDLEKDMHAFTKWLYDTGQIDNKTMNEIEGIRQGKKPEWMEIADRHKKS